MPLMNALLPLTLVAALAAAPVYADCPAPNDDIKIPDGATSTKDQMLAAQHAIKDADAAIATFADCLRNEQDAKIAAGGGKMAAAGKLGVRNEYCHRHKMEVEKRQK